MPYDPIQGQGHVGPIVAKMADVRVYLLRQYTCNDQRWIMVLRDSVQILSRPIFILILVQRYVSFKVTLMQTEAASHYYNTFLILPPNTNLVYI